MQQHPNNSESEGDAINAQQTYYFFLCPRHISDIFHQKRSAGDLDDIDTILGRM